MQVYQLAKEMGYDNKTFKTKISEIGITGKDSHFNKLTDSEIALIKSKIKNLSQHNTNNVSNVKKEKIESLEQKTNAPKEEHIIKEKVVFKENREIKNQNFHTDKKDNSKAFERNNRDGQRDVNRNFQNRNDQRDGNRNTQNRDGQRDGNRNFQNRNDQRDGNRSPQSRDGQRDGNRNFQNRNDQRDGNRTPQNRDGQREGNRNFQSRDGQRDGNRNFQNRDGQRDGNRTPQSRDGQRDGNRNFQNRDGQRDGNRTPQSRDGQKDGRNFVNNKRKEAPKDDVSSVVAPISEKPKANVKVNKVKFDKKKYEKEKKQKEEEKKLRELRSDFRKDDKKKKNKKKYEKAHKDEIVRLEGETIGMITIGEEIIIKDLAEKLGVNVSDIIKKFFMQGKMLTANAILTFEEAEEIALEHEVIIEREEIVKISYGEKYHLELEDKDQDLITRAPVITIMGHVDHGKTSLLDALRHTNVIEGEAGGITQKIGAYQVNWNGQKITFIDTPGHEAFTEMRARGANITDISILIVAADDGVKPQTVEAISHAKEAGVPIIVAINKIDKPGADPMRVRTELTEYGLMSPDWGGSTEFVEISAKQKINLEELLETILITAELQELKANPKKRPKAVVIESRLDPKMGAVADILIQEGELQIGDIFVAGESHGRVRSMLDDRGNKIEKSTLSQPVEITGFNTVPNAGDVLYGVNNDKQAKKIVEDFLKEKKANEQNKKKHISLESLSQELEDQQLKELKCIIRADSKGSVEALKESLLKLNNEKVMISIIQSSAGAVTEGDVKLAEASNAIIIAFNVRPTTPARNEAEKLGVEIRNYNVIYHVTEEIEKAMTGMLDPEFREVYLGRIEVKQVFKISNVGNIAGSIVVDGKVSRNSKIRVLRDGIITFEGEIETLKRFKDDAKEVVVGQECGIQIKDFNDIKESDIIESYIMEEIPR